MKLSDFSYQLPDRLIANFPTEQRTASRLLALDIDSGEITHKHFSDIVDLVNPEDLLVFNNTRVIPARLFARKESGGRAEILVERLLDERRLLAQIRVSKSPKTGTRLYLTHAEGGLESEDGASVFTVLGRQQEFFEIELADGENLDDVFDRFGHMPLPPYIKREDAVQDKERYQTVYAEVAGAVAAPTAGLHFDDELLLRLGEKGVASAFLTLHVGAGTFQPVRVENIEDHTMHSERIEVSESVVDAIRQCKAQGGRVIAVGTTSVRSLETAASSGELASFQGESDIFIYPGYEFRVVDAMITNFHLPESTLLMLVSAFASQKMILDAYREAVNEEYRFFSYGDAMFLHRKPV